MKAFLMTAMLLSAGAAWSAEPTPPPLPIPGPKPECPKPPKEPHHPLCVHGDKAKDIFDKLDVEAKVVVKGKFTFTTKATKGISCHEISSDKGADYNCCIHPEPKDPVGPKDPNGPKEPGSDSDDDKNPA